MPLAFQAQCELSVTTFMIRERAWIGEAFRMSITAPNADPAGAARWMNSGTTHHRLNSTAHGNARPSSDRTGRRAGQPPTRAAPATTTRTVITAINSHGGLSAR